MSGKQLKSFELNQKGNGEVRINGREFNAGMYVYAMIADGEIIGSRQLILTN